VNSEDDNEEEKDSMKYCGSIDKVSVSKLAAIPLSLCFSPSPCTFNCQKHSMLNHTAAVPHCPAAILGHLALLGLSALRSDTPECRRLSGSCFNRMMDNVKWKTMATATLHFLEALLPSSILVGALCDMGALEVLVCFNFHLGSYI
jgi:hypothetical protein